MALLLVVWLLGLLALLAATVTATSRGELRLTRNLVEAGRARALAEAGVARGVLALLANPADGGDAIWRADGTPYPFAFGDGEAVIVLQDEGGKIDINAAPGAVLHSLFVMAGLDDPAAAALADAVEDWRDADDLRRASGAEADDYQRDGRPYGPRNAPFLAIEELQQVLGMSPALYGRIAPIVTVQSRRPRVNPRTAPAAVLLALPGAVPDEIEAWLAARAAPPDDGAARRGQAAVLPVSIAPYIANAAVQSVTVRATARSAGGGVFVRDARVTLTGLPGRPVAITGWRQGEIMGSPAAP